MDTDDWCGLVVRTRARLRFGVVVGMFTEGPYAGRLRVHGPYHLAGRRGEERLPCILGYAIPRDAVQLTRRGVLRLPGEAIAARAAWLVAALPQHDVGA
jgi:hypothetical protein